MIKGHQIGCGQYGYSLVSFLFFFNKSIAISYILLLVRIWTTQSLNSDFAHYAAQKRTKIVLLLFIVVKYTKFNSD